MESEAVTRKPREQRTVQEQEKHNEVARRFVTSAVAAGERDGFSLTEEAMREGIDQVDAKAAIWHQANLGIVSLSSDGIVGATHLTDAYLANQENPAA